MIRVLIADDSAFMRKAISKIIEKDSNIKVAGFAKNGEETIEKVKELNPDVLTLDIEMPLLNGLDALKIIMKENPLPVLMLSSLTKKGADETLKALELGAIDYIPKNLSYVSLDILKLEKDIIKKIKIISKKKLSPRTKFKKSSEKIKHIEKYNGHYSIIAIGASTGGPSAVQKLITGFPANLPCGVVIAQHMPEGFTKSFAERLDSISQLRVKEAESGEIIRKGIVYIAPGNKNMSLKKRGAKVFIYVENRKANTIYKPSVDMLIGSVSKIYGRRAIGIILTGMGNDGLEGMKKLRKKKGLIIAQNEETSVIYGMPKAIVDNSLADKIVPLDNIAKEVLKRL